MLKNWVWKLKVISCQPEGHPKNARQKDDIRHLKEKVDVEFTIYEDILERENGKLFEIIYKIDNSEIEVSYSIDMLDESDGAESNLTIFYKLNDDNYHKI